METKIKPFSNGVLFSPTHPQTYRANGLCQVDWCEGDVASWNLIYLSLPLVDEYTTAKCDPQEGPKPEAWGALLALASPDLSKTLPGLRQALQTSPSEFLRVSQQLTFHGVAFDLLGKVWVNQMKARALALSPERAKIDAMIDNVVFGKFGQ